jgi:hypothetical protein
MGCPALSFIPLIVNVALPSLLLSLGSRSSRSVGLSIPMAIGTSDAIRNLFYKALAVEVKNTSWICVAMDQLLGRATGHIFNDEAAAVATGRRSPEQAAGVIEKSWYENRICDRSVNSFPLGQIMRVPVNADSPKGGLLMDVG